MAEKVTRSKAIRLKCLDCCGGMPGEVRKCEVDRCPLHPFRMGKVSAKENAEEAKLTESIVS